MNIRYFIIAIVLLASTASCKKFLEIDEPVDRMTTSAVFADSVTAAAAVAGVYEKIVQSTDQLVNGGATLLTGLSGDELQPTSDTKSAAEFYKNNILPRNETNASLWTGSYTLIYQCNNIIAQLSASSLSRSLREQLTGEALFLRALHYFYLVNTFGEVPLATTPDYRINSTLARATTGQVYAQMEKDLQEARTLLGTSSNDHNRATQWAVIALQARVLLYQQRWAEAAAAAREVIDGGAFTLVPLTDVFLKDSKEAILQFPVALSSIQGSPNVGVFLPANAASIPAYTLTPNLIDAFEDGDLRKQQWVGSNDVNGKVFQYPAKYKVRETVPGSVKPENNTVLRLAELYLIRAEAQAQLGKIKDAVNDVDKVRQRAGLLLLADINPTISKDDLLQAIAHERRIELFAEHGHRWLDLKRTGQVEAVLAALKPGWKPIAVLYPVPLAEILAAPQLKQNPGY